MRGWASLRESARMRVSLMVDQASSFVGRIVMFSMELTLSITVILGGIYLGHQLREWREWYWALPPAFESPTAAPAVTEP
jgi:hypothetical protein